MDHRHGLFYIRTNDMGKNFRVVTAPVESPGRESWKELIALDPEAPLEGFDLFASFCVSSRRRMGLPTLTLTEFAADDALGRVEGDSISGAGLFGGHAYQSGVRDGEVPV